MKVLRSMHPTQNRIGHFGDFRRRPSQCSSQLSTIETDLHWSQSIR